MSRGPEFCLYSYPNTENCDLLAFSLCSKGREKIFIISAWYLSMTSMGIAWLTIWKVPHSLHAFSNSSFAVDNWDPSLQCPLLLLLFLLLLLRSSISKTGICRLISSSSSCEDGELPLSPQCSGFSLTVEDMVWFVSCCRAKWSYNLAKPNCHWQIWRQNFQSLVTEEMNFRSLKCSITDWKKIFQIRLTKCHLLHYFVQCALYWRICTKLKWLKKSGPQNLQHK